LTAATLSIWCRRVNPDPPQGLLKPLLSPEEANAVNHYIAGCSLPIVEELDEAAAVLATANFFEAAGRCFLVTASHSFEDFDPERMGILVKQANDRRCYMTLNGCRRYYWEDEDLDVTVVEVQDPDLAAALRRTYQSLGPEAVARHGERFSQYIIAGFPRSGALCGPGHIEPRAMKLTTTPFEGMHPEGFRFDREFLLTFAESGRTPNGTLKPSQPLQGLSGAAVWGVATPGSGCVWTPRSAVRVVGIQHAYKKTAYIRCHRWWLVARMLEQMDSTIGAEFMAALSSSNAT
jgi:hypothetical protein